jgi:acyl-coenzyme A synthetase/AMP-(fatty) acid ligase
VKGGVEAARGGLKEELRDHVSKHIGAIAKPDEVRFAEALPKTRSGKIMRRLLKEIASGAKSPATRRRWRTSACWQNSQHQRNRHICPMPSYAT